MWGTFTNGCVLCMEVVDRSTAGRWVQEVEKRSCMIDCGLGVLSQPPAVAGCMLQRADDIIHVDWRITSWQVAIQLSVSNGSAMAIIDALGYSKVCARWVPRSLTTEHRCQRKVSVLNCWSMLMLRVRPFCPRSSQVMKPGLTIMSRR